MKLVFTSTARRDLHEIGDYIARDSRRQALRFVTALEGFCTTLVAHPERCPLVTGREERGVRRAVQGDYLVFYRLNGGRVEVLRVLHAARDVERLLDGF